MTTTPAPAANEFDALLGDLDLFTKAMASGDGDAMIAGAAAEGAEGDEGDEGGEGEGGEGGEGQAAPGGDDSVMGKSFGVTLADGSQEDVYDATALLKSLMDDRDTMRVTVAHQGSQLTSALAALKGAVGALRSTGELVKALQSDVKRLGNTGGGRRAVLDVHERHSAAAPAAAAAPAGLKASEFMAKAMEMNKAGDMTAIEISRLEMGFERGRMPDADTIARVMGG